MLATWNFDNRFVGELPADPATENFCREVQGACYSRVTPTPVAAPRLLAFSADVATLLDLDPAVCCSEDFVATFSGNRLLPAMGPYAMCYGGHQFGHWAGQLGDGRAINLGEIINAKGERWALQLKGAGRTPYSRSADGLAVMRSSVREFLCSEAMHYLGVPTTRALSLIASGETVIRDMFYDGHPRAEPGAILCRVAPSFVRFGNFEIFAARGDVETLRKLADFTIRTDFPELGAPATETYLAWFEEVCTRTRKMIVEWLRVGFVHGVMNTDNMSVLGLTIDYGPYGWLEDYDPNWTPNTTDARGRRYRFGQQGQVAVWNLVQLANAIYPLINATEPLEAIITACAQQYKCDYRDMMRAKLGLEVSHADNEDQQLIDELISLLPAAETDMTIFFRALAELAVEPSNDANPLAGIEPAFYTLQAITPALRARWIQWLAAYQRRLADDKRPAAVRRAAMQRINPKYVLRNYLAQLAIDSAERGEHKAISDLLEVLRHPYDEQPKQEHYARKRPDWARTRPGCSMLSCSS